MSKEQTSKTILIILALGVVAVIGIVVYSHRATKNITSTNVTENVPTTTDSSWPSTKIGEQTITDNNGAIKASYPVVKDDTITGYFKTFVQDSVTQFKSDTSWATSNTPASASAGDLSLTIMYKEEKSTNADNYIFSSSSYEGGAHGLESTKTFSFSPTGQLITLNTLFTNGNQGLSEIVPYVRQQLASTLPKGDQSFINDGTTATSDNYGTFTVQKDGVTFIFDPYQVAPYSDGQQTVKVPASVFKDIANPDLFK